MKRKIINDDIYGDNEGVSLGNVGSYIKRFKDQEKRTESIPFNPKNNFLKDNVDDEEDFDQEEGIPSRISSNFKKVKITQNPNDLPEKISDDNEKKVYVYYYCKFGNLDCDDFNQVKGKVASAINRLYGKSLTPQDVLDKLEKYVSPADIDLPMESETNSNYTESSPKKNNSLTSDSKKISIELEEKDYPFIKNLEDLNEEQKDLLMFIKSENLCFSSDGYNFFLTVKDKNCFDNLFDFDPKEKIVYNLFKEQLGDEYKAKKLVLMSRILNEGNSKTAKTTNTRKKSK
jgi:hypothetical protein